MLSFFIGAWQTSKCATGPKRLMKRISQTERLKPDGLEVPIGLIELNDMWTTGPNDLIRACYIPFSFWTFKNIHIKTFESFI